MESARCCRVRAGRRGGWLGQTPRGCGRGWRAAERVAPLHGDKFKTTDEGCRQSPLPTAYRQRVTLTPWLRPPEISEAPPAGVRQSASPPRTQCHGRRLVLGNRLAMVFFGLTSPEFCLNSSRWRMPCLTQDVTLAPFPAAEVRKGRRYGSAGMLDFKGTLGTGSKPGLGEDK